MSDPRVHMNSAEAQREVDGLNANEKKKLDWLYGVYLGYKALTKQQREDADVALWAEGVVIQTDVNRQQVSNYVTPELLVVWAHDGRKDMFDEFPAYAVVPRIGCVIRIRDVVVTSVSSHKGDEVGNALRTLELAGSSLDGTRKETVLKTVRVLRRTLKVTT